MAPVGLARLDENIVGYEDLRPRRQRGSSPAVEPAYATPYFLFPACVRAVRSAESKRRVALLRISCRSVHWREVHVGSGLRDSQLGGRFRCALPPRGADVALR